MEFLIFQSDLMDFKMQRVIFIRDLGFFLAQNTIFLYVLCFEYHKIMTFLRDFYLF
jgi:hypothetical protein